MIKTKQIDFFNCFLENYDIYKCWQLFLKSLIPLSFGFDLKILLNNLYFYNDHAKNACNFENLQLEGYFFIERISMMF